MSQASNAPSEPRVIANRYEIRADLGRGGMASVYLATDRVLRREVALKALRLPDSPREREGLTTLFEREFHTLSQLAHPRVIAVYDYGVTSDGPYYTMELLDGGDLRERAPLAWQTACELFFDVCSSLALLHSRRLLHRDISPRNIRCTRDGKAKLIDFGAMAPMGSGGATLVGTPPYTAPETVQRLALDARADLFSLGVTLYSTLTGHVPYPVRTFADAPIAWRVKPAAPSARVANIPPALDELVLDLISIEPSLRPPSASDVMQRLAAIADLTRDESAEVSAAYLATPTLVGRDDLIGAMPDLIRSTIHEHGRAVMIRAAPGMGRSRALDACTLEAKTLGASVLRVTATGEPESFAVARAWTQQLLSSSDPSDLVQAYPEVFSSAAANGNAGEGVQVRGLADRALDPERVQQALCRFLLTASRKQPLVLAIDDVQRIDDASAAVLAALTDRLNRGNALVVLTAETSDDAPSRAVDVLSRRCLVLDLPALSRAHSYELLSSVFGDVANLEMVASEIHNVALGNPRVTMDLAQHLVDHGVIRYGAGTWTLPAQLTAANMPRTSEARLGARLDALSPEARLLAECHALAYSELLGGEHFRALRPEADPLTTDHAVSELLAAGVIRAAGDVYGLSSRVWTAALLARLDGETLRARHLALAQMYRPSLLLAVIYHAFAASDEEAGLEAIARRHEEYAKGFDSRVIDHRLSKLVPAYHQAIDAALRRQRPGKEINELRRWAVALSVTAEGAGYASVAPIWFAQLRHDSGLDLWQADREPGSAGDRLTRALTRAHERYVATPEAQRVYTIEEAIRLLAEYVVLSIAIGARTLDLELLSSLPRVLEPFAPLSPILDAIWNNAIATEESQCDCQYDRARTRWIDVLHELDALPAGEIPHLDSICNAVASAVGLMEAQIGLPTATRYAERLDHDPYQRLSAVHLRKLVRLSLGDWAGAARHRREAEVLSLQSGALQMFNMLVLVEVTVYAMARDLSGMQQGIEQLRLIAAKQPAWDMSLRVAEAFFDLTRGDHAAALRGFEAAVASTAIGPDGKSKSLAVWLWANAGLGESLSATHRVQEARERLRAVVQLCELRQIGTLANDCVRLLALAEAMLGDVAPAVARLEVVIQAQLDAGVSGPRLGLSYEARARIAIWNADEVAFAHYSRLTAQAYHRGVHSPLATRYERLMDEALRAGFHPKTELADFESSTLLDSQGDVTYIETHVLRFMAGAQRGEERAKRALRLLCEALGARGGHLYLLAAERPTLSASHGDVSAASDLDEHVQQYLAEEQARSDTLTEIAAGDIQDSAVSGPYSTVSTGGANYELLVLNCIERGEGVVVGVAAVLKGERRVHHIKQTQLLNTLAAHLQSRETWSDGQT